MAHKKAGTSTSNGRDSAGRRLAKVSGTVKFKRGLNDRKTVSVVPDTEAK